MSTFFPPIDGTSAQYGTIWIVLLLATALLIGLWWFMHKAVMRTSILRYLSTVVVMGFIVYWFRFENVMYFTADWIIWLWVAVVAIGLLWLLSIRLIKVPKVKAKQSVVDTKTKYLPKSKNTKPRIKK
ncbi:MAG: hypothetical protein WC773_04225 [Patescibacteria group bacterium]|jgi:hypothetical protein